VIKRDQPSYMLDGNYLTYAYIAQTTSKGLLDKGWPSGYWRYLMGVLVNHVRCRTSLIFPNHDIMNAANLTLGAGDCAKWENELIIALLVG